MSKLEKFRLGVWVALVLMGMGFGIAAGASLFAGVGSYSIALFGLLATLALMATQVALHREHPIATSKSDTNSNL